ncbi:MAG: indolepyruvate oxidoreductase subunit beta [Clostridia bacterium]|nr:indolepyruvate oxidoreductase subunit beta [Clostridia bacterium]
METRSIMIVGVGGQGTLLASRILGNVLLRQGFDVKVSEVHGMSQRGGSVVTYVRYGEKVCAPIVDKGGADTVLAFELLEAKRALPYLKPGGRMLVNTQQIDPMPVIMGNAAYPAGITDELKEKSELTAVDALSLARQAGNQKAVNVVLIGLLAKTTDIPFDVWTDVLAETVPAKFLEVNKQAFSLGYHA